MLDGASIGGDVQRACWAKIAFDRRPPQGNSRASQTRRLALEPDDDGDALGPRLIFAAGGTGESIGGLRVACVRGRESAFWLCFVCFLLFFCASVQVDKLLASGRGWGLEGRSASKNSSWEGCAEKAEASGVRPR